MNGGQTQSISTGRRSNVSAEYAGVWLHGTAYISQVYRLAGAGIETDYPSCVSSTDAGRPSGSHFNTCKTPPPSPLGVYHHSNLELPEGANKRVEALFQPTFGIIHRPHRSRLVNDNGSWNPNGGIKLEAEILNPLHALECR